MFFVSGFGGRLQEIRKAKGLKQEELSAQVGITRPTLSQYETDRSCPDGVVLKKLSDVLGVSTDYLLGITNTAYFDLEYSQISAKTGLSEKAIRKLSNITNNKNSKYSHDEYREIINLLLDTDTPDILSTLYDILIFDTKSENREKDRYDMYLLKLQRELYELHQKLSK